MYEGRGRGGEGGGGGGGGGGEGEGEGVGGDVGTMYPVHVRELFTGSFRFDIEETPCEMKSVGETPLDNTHFLISKKRCLLHLGKRCRCVESNSWVTTTRMQTGFGWRTSLHCHAQT